jgi:uncharacterized protein
MSRAVIGLVTLELYLPGVASLKEKRSIVKSMLARVQKQFNISAAEVGENDRWQTAVIAIVTVTNSPAHAQQILTNTIEWIEGHFPNLYISRQETEIL